MRLPKITIAVDKDDGFAFGEISPALVIGFGIRFTWMFSMQFSANRLFFATATAETSSISQIASLGFFLTTFFVYVVFFPQMCRIFDTPDHRNRNRLIAALATVLGGFLLFGCTTASLLGWSCIIASGFLTGVGSAVLLMSYGVSFSVLETPTISLGVAFSLPVASLAYLAISVIGSISPAFSAIVAVLIPLAEFFCLQSCSRQLVDRLSFASYTISVQKASFALHIIAPSFLFGLAVGGIRHYVLIGTIWLPTSEVTNAVVLMAACLMAGLLVLGAAILQHSTVNYMFRTLLPVSATCLAVALFDNQYASLFNSGLQLTGYLLIEGCCWMFYADISQRYRISAFQTFGLGRGALALGILVHALFSSPADISIITAEMASQNLVAVLTWLCIGFALLPTNKEMLKLLKRGTPCPALTFDEDFLFATTTSNAPADHNGPECSPAAVETSPDDSASAKDNKPAAMAASPVSQETTTSVAAEELCVSDEAPTKSSPAVAIVQDRTSVPDEEGRRQQGRFRRQCEIVADRYLLSRREAEVLFLLAKGRNAAFIQEKLFISEGTARTHMRHIYAKLNVHSQKELMDLVEQEQTEA